MTPQWPVVDVLFEPHRGAWKLTFAPLSWDPPFLRRHMNDRREVFPVRRPDLEELERYMWDSDAPYVKRVAVDGSVGLFARGLAGWMLGFWIADLIKPWGT